jgi:hypothetical protein
MVFQAGPLGVGEVGSVSLSHSRERTKPSRLSTLQNMPLSRDWKAAVLSRRCADGGLGHPWLQGEDLPRRPSRGRSPARSVGVDEKIWRWRARA